jgi:hypothetical protein
MFYDLHGIFATLIIIIYKLIYIINSYMYNKILIFLLIFTIIIV